MLEKKDTIDFDKSMQSVPDKTIGNFLDLLSENKDYQEISERLRSEIFSKNKLSESAIKKAVFGDDDL